MMPWLCNTCSDCLKGEYTDQEGNGFTSSCNNCNYGKYSDQTGQTSCKECSAGKYTGSTEWTNYHHSCKGCDVGYYSDENGKNLCTLDNKCSSGKYYEQSTPRTSGGTCKTCAGGKWKEVKGQFYGSTIVIQHHHTSCDDQGSCGTGKGNAAYNTPNRDKDCQNCVGAQYSDVNDNTACKTGNCDVNQHVVACNSGCTSTPGCTGCLSGKHIPFASGRTSCVDKCGTGQYWYGGTSLACTTCGPGTYQDETSHLELSCKSCGSNKQPQNNNDVGGAYVNDGATKCVTCGAGYDNPNGGGACNECGTGKYATSGNECQPCSGNKQTQTTSTVGGTYISSGATQCVTCADGYENTNSGACDACPEGSDYNAAGEGCKTYEQKYLDVDTKPTVSAVKTRAQNNHWIGLSSTRKKREGFRAMIKWLRSQFTSRKAKMRKEDLILSTTFKTRMATALRKPVWVRALQASAIIY
jgi:hypothetical protein